MNRIKIIKRANLHTPPPQGESKAKKAEPAADKRQAVRVIGNWIDEWRASKPKDARRAFSDLFNGQPSATA